MTRRQLLFYGAVDLALVAVAFLAFRAFRDDVPVGLEGYATGGMSVSSPAFGMNGPIPEKFSCEGEGVSPPLELHGVPRDAKSVAIAVDDIDAPFGGFVHWTVWNLAPTVDKIPESELPPNAVVGKNGAGANAYAPPCPPTGVHRYVFRAFAFDEVLKLDAEAAPKEILRYFEDHAIARAALLGTYRK